MPNTLKSTITAQPLNQEAFAPFGDIIDIGNCESFLINNGKCRRHHAITDVIIEDDSAKPIISIFSGTPYSLPHTLDMVERHPLGSQAFIPLHDDPFLVIVSEDKDGVPQAPKAFITAARQGINLKPNTWHGVLTPIIKAADFLVVDRGSNEDNGKSNLEEHFFKETFMIDV